MTTFKIRYPLNEDGSVNNISPIKGIMSMAEKRDVYEIIECELYNQEDTPNGEFEEMSPEEAHLHEIPWDTPPEKVDRVAKLYANLVQPPEEPAWQVASRREPPAGQVAEARHWLSRQSALSQHQALSHCEVSRKRALT